MIRSERLVREQETVHVSLPASGHWHHAPKTKRRRTFRKWLNPEYSLSAVFICMVTSFWFLSAMVLEVGQLGFRLLLVLVFPVITVRVIGHTVREASLTVDPEDMHLIDDIRGLDLMVETSLFVNGRLIGKDRGMLGFANDAMYFTGHSFSFLVGSQDLVWRRNLWLHFVDPYVRQIDLKHPTSRVSVRFAVLRGKNWNAKEKMRFLTGALKALKRYPPTSSPRQYPPLERWSPDELS